MRLEWVSGLGSGKVRSQAFGYSGTGVGDCSCITSIASHFLLVSLEPDRVGNERLMQDSGTWESHFSPIPSSEWLTLVVFLGLALGRSVQR